MTQAALRIGGRLLAGWTDIVVSDSLERLSSDFRFTMSERSPGELTPRLVNPGDAVVVDLDGETVLTGYVDTVSPQYTSESHAIVVSGRDATGDLVDCSAFSQPGEWHGASLAAIVTDLCAPYGIPVHGAPEREPFRKFRIQEGETVFEAIDRACRSRRVFPRSDGRGGLTLGPVATSRAEVRLERGVNILSASGRADHSGRFSEYVLYAQQQGDEFLTPEGAAHVYSETRDHGIRRVRRRVVIAEDPLDIGEADERIRWERDVRAARAREARVVVQGWRERGDAGALWRHGRLVHIKCDWLGLDLTMLVSSVSWSRNDSEGTTTKLTLMHERAFDHDPVTPELTDEEGSSFWN